MSEGFRPETPDYSKSIEFNLKKESKVSNIFKSNLSAARSDLNNDSNTKSSSQSSQQDSSSASEDKLNELKLKLSKSQSGSKNVFGNKNNPGKSR
jgi:hypothetical protein